MNCNIVQNEIVTDWVSISNNEALAILSVIYPILKIQYLKLEIIF